PLRVVKEAMMSLTAAARRTIALSSGVLLALGAVGTFSTAGSASTRAAGSASSLNVKSFTSDFTAMSALKSVAAKGKGKVVVLLPDTQSSQRYVQYDAPLLMRAFKAAGLSSDQVQVQNAQGSTQTMQTQAEAAITNGASVLLVDALDSGSGAAI